MNRFFALALTLVLLVSFSAVAPAGEKCPGHKGAKEGSEDGCKCTWLDFSGFYAFNAYSQNNFFLGKSAASVDDGGAVGGVSDKDNYAIQMFRLKMVFGTGKNLKAVVRTDLAQGIWGIDNNTRDGAATPGFSALFNHKDTNFLTHVDWAYIDFLCDKTNTNIKLGRQKFALGNLLVLDQNSDGIILTQKLDENGKLGFAWAKMYEGSDGLSDEDALGPGGMNALDADLFLLDYKRKMGDWKINPFYAYYNDSGDGDDTAYLPQGLQYFRTRFIPQISEAHAVGFAFNGKSGPVVLKGEFDYLTGKDDIANANSGAKELLDVNNGDLTGYNFYVDARIDAGPGKLGAIVGYGSGDDDVTGGEGNINKIRTNGFFYLSEIWEDSVMPDEEGITPQGLGSPASRGYREFENSTVLQLNYSIDLCKKANLFVSGMYVQANENLHPWKDVDPDGDGPDEKDGVIDFTNPDEYDKTTSSTDLGYEVNAKLTLRPHPGLAWLLRAGAFFPGDAAGYLINGTADYTDTAWELRTTVKYSFKGITISG